MRVGLIACAATKAPHAAPARELYRSQLFTAARDWISKPGRVEEWGILSARHGLVLPDDVLEPYDQCLAEMTAEHRAIWATATQTAIVARWGRDAIYLCVLGEHYKIAVHGLPFVEDAIRYWTMVRRERGMSSREAAMSIGVLTKYLREGRAYGC